MTIKELTDLILESAPYPHTQVIFTYGSKSFSVDIITWLHEPGTPIEIKLKEVKDE